MYCVLMESLDIPGYGFDPTHEQLLNHYLKQRIVDHFAGATSQGTLHRHIIPDIDLYEWDPKELPSFFRAHSQAVPNRKHCFFFCRLNKKYRNSKRADRTVKNIGYWKATCKERSLSGEDGGADLGTRKTLVFLRGRDRAGDRTGWVMHEYHLNPTYLGYPVTEEMPFVLCRIKKKDDDELVDEEGYNHGGYETIQQDQTSGYDEDEHIWGSLSSIQNLGADFRLGKCDGSYGGGYDGIEVYDKSTWMAHSAPYQEDCPNNWITYN